MHGQQNITKFPAHIEYELGLAVGRVWKSPRADKLLVPPGIRTQNRPARNERTALSWLPVFTWRNQKHNNI